MNNILKIWVIGACFLALGACDKNDSFSNANQGAGGSTARMTISGSYLYVATNSNLYTYDIADPAKTVLLNSVYTNGNVETIFSFRDKLFLGSRNGMSVFDLSNPKKPEYQATASHFRACDPVVADESFAYVTLRNNNSGCGGKLNQLNIYNIEGNNILTPSLVSELELPQPHGLGFKENTLFVCCGVAGLQIIDITDKADPKVVKTIKEDDYIDVIPYGNLLVVYVKGGIVLYDITDARNPSKLSLIKS